MKWRHSHKKPSRGVYLIMSRTNKMGRIRRLSKMVMGDVHLSIYIFFLEAFNYNEMEAYI